MEGDAMGDRSTPETVCLPTPNVARMYDYYLGGKDNFAADRDAAEQALEFAPQIRIAAQHNRAFMGRAVRPRAEAGIRQFLDIGTGLPTQSNVHEVAREAAPDARVVYVDNDPVVLPPGRAIRGRRRGHRPRRARGRPGHPGQRRERAHRPGRPAPPRGDPGQPRGARTPRL